MDTLQEIQIIDLLSQREAELVKVAQAEEAIRELLGGVAFPFPAPPDLPSRHKPRGKLLRRRAAVDMSEEALPGLRRLEAEVENAYHLVYRYNGEKKESFQADFDFLQLLQTFPGEAFQLLRIEAVFFRTPEDWQVRSLLWQTGSE
ncbi:MAG: hypothetical protein WCT05_09875, partial [Lentisphaeria bacterium]